MGFPKLHHTSNLGGYNIMIIEILGKNLEELLNLCNKFSIKTVCMVALQIVNLFVHHS